MKSTEINNINIFVYNKYIKKQFLDIRNMNTAFQKISY